MPRYPVKYMVLGILVGLLIGSLGLIGYSYVSGLNLFDIGWRGARVYHVRIDLEYIYVHVYNASSNTPLIGGKTLLEYIVIVRVENPYKNLVIVPGEVNVGLYESLSVNSMGAISGGNDSYRIIHDSYRDGRILSYAALNDLFRGSCKLVIDRNIVNNWLFGGDRIGSRKYYVLKGVIELPDYAKNTLKGNSTTYYFIVGFSGDIQDSIDKARGQLIGIVRPYRVDNHTYVFNRVSYGGGIELVGDTIETFHGGIWP